MNEPDAWAAVTANWPVAFAQVREDATQDVRLVQRLPAEARVLMVASGGCTAAALACLANVAELHLVDANPAQLALCRLKLHLLDKPRDERLRLVGHADMNIDERCAALQAVFDSLSLPADVLGPADEVAELGPDHVGRYELLFGELRRVLSPVHESLNALLSMHDCDEQSRCVSFDAPLGEALDAALDQVMALANLVKLFGTDATNNPVEPFSRHFARRIRHVLATIPAATNPYLWQMLAGRYPPAAAAPWFDCHPPATMPRVEVHHAFMADVLAEHDHAFDYVHLSNILDWLSVPDATRTLALAHRALRPGGWVMIRQLNSSLDVRSAGSMFEWDVEWSDKLHAGDRSFFYRCLHVGRKR